MKQATWSELVVDVDAPKNPDLLSSKEAIRLLGVKSDTFYTYVGRGWIRRIPHQDGKHNLYLRQDLERIRARSEARSGHAAVAAASMRWGEPVIESSITELTLAGPSYRGKLAVDLAESGCSFESVAELLWTSAWSEEPIVWQSPPSLEEGELSSFIVDGQTGLLDLFSFLVLRRGAVARRAGRPTQDIELARQTILQFVGCLGFLTASRKYIVHRTGENVAAYVARILGVPLTTPPLNVINAALIVSADHELSPTTLAARVAASTGGDYHSCIGVAIYTELGITGGCDQVEKLLRGCSSREDFQRRAGVYHEAKRCIPGFNHPFYPNGDPRALYLLEIARRCCPGKKLARIIEFVDEACKTFGSHPSMGFGLVAVCEALDMPPHTASALWTIGWTAGWSAHIAEQRGAGFMLRPRAKYTNREPVPAKRLE